MQTERKKKEGSLMVDRMDKRKPVKLTRSEKKAMRRTEKTGSKIRKRTGKGR